MARHLGNRIIGFVFCLISMTSLGYAVSYSESSYKDTLPFTDKIIIGKIKNYKPIYFNSEKQETLCGWSATVIPDRVIKGNNDEFIVFMRDYEIDVNDDSTYLVIAYDTSRFSDAGKKAYCHSDENKIIDISAYPFAAMGFLQFVFLIEPYAGQKFGGEWIKEEQYSGAYPAPLVWDYVPIFKKFIPEKENPDIPDFYIIYDLDDFISTNLEN